MAILHTLRTNRILKIFTFIVVGIGMYLFVDPKFDVPLSIYYSITCEERNSGLNDTDVGYIYGQKAEREIRDGRGSVINEWNFDQRINLLSFYKSNPQQPFFSFGTVLNFRDIIISDFVWDDFITRSYVDYEMDKMGFSFSNIEQVDLYQGTITGTDNLHPLFRSWWAPLGLCNRQANPLCLDTISSIQLEENINNWREDLEFSLNDNQSSLTPEQINAQNLLSQDELYKKIYIEDESKVQKYFSIYQNGHFTPDDIVINENLNENKSASGKYIYIPFRDISGQFNFSPSDKEILDYYNNHSYKFINNNKTRELDYYMFTSENDDDESVDNLFNNVREFKNSASTVEGFKEQSKNYEVKTGSVSLKSIMQNKILSEIDNNFQEVRDLVRWAYGINVEDNEFEEVNIGDIYHFQMYDIQIIFCLKEINEDDYQSVEKVRTEIIKELTNQARGLEIQTRVNQKIDINPSIDELYELLKTDFNNLQLENIENLKFTDNKFKKQNLNDPELIGTFFGIPLGLVSKPFIGKEGVYILFKNDQENNSTISIEQTRRKLVSNSGYLNPLAFRDQIITYAKESESIEDRRFFVY